MIAGAIQASPAIPMFGNAAASNSPPMTAPGYRLRSNEDNRFNLRSLPKSSRNASGVLVKADA